MDAIDRISQDMTVITIAHRLSTVQNADMIYVMKDGRICESGYSQGIDCKRKGILPPL